MICSENVEKVEGRGNDKKNRTQKVVVRCIETANIGFYEKLYILKKLISKKLNALQNLPEVSFKLL